MISETKLLAEGGSSAERDNAMMQVPLRALVLHEMIGSIDLDIKSAEERGEDLTALRAERQRLANQAMFYLNQAVPVKRPRKKQG